MALVKMFLRSLEFRWFFIHPHFTSVHVKRAPSVVLVLRRGHGGILSSTCQGASAPSIALFLSVPPLQLETQAHMGTIIQQILPIENG